MQHLQVGGAVAAEVRKGGVWTMHQERLANGRIDVQIGEAGGTDGPIPTRPIRVTKITGSGNVTTTSGGAPGFFLFVVWNSSVAAGDRILALASNLQVPGEFTVRSTAIINAGKEILYPSNGEYLVGAMGSAFPPTWGVRAISMVLEWVYV